MQDPDNPGLTQRVRVGDKRAFEQLLAPVILPAARMAFLMLQSRAEAEDVVQEAAIKAWRKLDQLRKESDFRPWFLGIVVNECRTVRRSRWWSISGLEHAQPQPAEGPESEVLASTDLRHALQRLAPDQRAAILMHFYMDLPLEQVASALGISVPGVKSRINRALKVLRPALRRSEAPA